MGVGALDQMVKESLHKWFSHKNGGGGGWVDCKASKKGHLVPCGRSEGGRRRGYPACRPTIAQCNSRKSLKSSSERISWKKQKK